MFLVKCFAEFGDFANPIIEKMGSQKNLIFISLILNEAAHLFVGKRHLGSPLEVLWLGLHAFTVTSLGSAPGWGTRISQAAWCG